MKTFFLSLLIPVCFFGGCFPGFIFVADRKITDPRAEKFIPLPHHFPENPDDLTFRFAMVHDVIHERYRKHGEEYYREKDRKSRQKLQSLLPGSKETLEVLDDLSSGLHLKENDPAVIKLLHDKLQMQQSHHVPDRKLIATKACLGSMLLFHSQKSGANDSTIAEAKKILEEVVKNADVTPSNY